jgi:NAD(P)-dependent dehydrogenase (short-subunit alcohol dehydrogenase family)
VTLIQQIWRHAKRWRRIPLGPVSLVFRMSRHIPISRNLPRSPVFSRGRVRVCEGPPSLNPEGRSDQSDAPPAPRCETAVIVGAGPGFGFSLARRLAEASIHVAVASRRTEHLDELVTDMVRAGGVARAYGCDATDEGSVAALFRRVSAEFGVPDLVVYGVQGFAPGRMLEMELPAFEDSWRQNCLGAFIVSREAARCMAPLGRGSIIVVGSTSSLVGREGYLNLAVGKFGLRALAHVMARELWPLGIHVAHLILDAHVHEGDGTELDKAEPQADGTHIAEAVYALHRQPRTAWTSELDIRPWNERFWEHC